MNLPVNITNSNIFSVLRSFLMNVLPNGNSIFTGQISGTVLTVTKVQYGTLAVGDVVTGPGLLPGTIIQSFGNATGTTGTYNISQSQTVASQILATGVPVLQGQVNRVPETAAADYVVMWPLRRERLETNVDTTADAKFTGTISGTTLTITNVFHGSLKVGSPLYGVGIAAGSQVLKFIGGTGGLGTYLITPSQNISSQVISAGTQQYLQPTLLTMQLDVHGPNSAENAQIISTMMRDDYAVEFFAATGYDVVPCYADDPKQIPFINGEAQYENRWIVEAVLQANIVVVAGQQYADSVIIGLIDVDERYPP